MEAFPRKVHLSISIHGGLPAELYFNDLKVFRAAIALLTSACERTQEGFVRFKMYPQDEGDEARVIVFECEDTGRDVDLERFEELFQAPADGIDVGYEECINVNRKTGEMEHSPAGCEDRGDRPVAGGFAVHPVADYVGSMGGKYGFRPRFVTGVNAADSGSGSVFWFSIPLRTVKAGSTGGIPGTSTLDSAIDSALAPTPLAAIEHTVVEDSSQSIHRVDASAARTSWF
mmetsp:Transcript_27076/g.56717  ORF Transcript_27076/g.56717 Transcript_27076/m.56717 type:complete len:230 (-) Transcript_27076:882-1571(-)